MNQDSVSIDHVTHSRKGKASKLIKRIINIIQFKSKATSKCSPKEDSVTETLSDSSSEENITLDSTESDQESLTSTSSDDDSTLKVSYSPSPKTLNAWNQPSTSSHPRFNSTSDTRRPIPYQNVSIQSNLINGTRRGCSKPISSNPGPRPSYLSSQSVHSPKTQAESRNCSYPGSFTFHLPIPTNSESNSRRDDVCKVIGRENEDSWSLACGNVSPKIFEDSVKFTEDQLYAPLKYVRMEMDRKGKKDAVPRQDTKQPTRPPNSFGILAHEQDEQDAEAKRIDQDRELDKLFFTALRTVEILTEIMVNILTIKTGSCSPQS